MLGNMRGGSTLGCLVVVALLAAGMYVGYKFALAQWDYEGMKEELTEIARYWGTEGKPNIPIIKQEIITKAEKHNVTVNEEDIIIKPAEGVLTIEVYWVVPIEFPGSYVYNREFSVTRTIRR